MTIFSPCRSQYGTRSGTRAIVPSSFMISQTTPAGVRPARRARSTAASVCPTARARRRLGRAAGRRAPGCTRSCGVEVGSIATWIVRARSAAEMPVVTPSRASIETVNAVPNCASFCSVIGAGRAGRSAPSVRQRQIRPRACVAMKLIASGVANWAAITRSPSFSRSGSSTTTTKRPLRISSIASSMVANGLVSGFVVVLNRAIVAPLTGGPAAARRTSRARRPRGSPPSRRRARRASSRSACGDERDRERLRRRARRP